MMICRKLFVLIILSVLALGTMPITASANDKDKPTPIELDHFIGYWQSPDNEDNKMAIVRPDGGWLGKAKKGDVEVHSDKRAWKGWIEKKPTEYNPKNQVLRLSYLPRAEEINNKIPLSLREDLDGVLEWKMEISLPNGAYGDEAKAIWHRGHIEWEKSLGGKVGSHKITGDGEPIEFTLKRKPMLQIEMGGGITMDVRLAADIGMDRPEGAILQNLIQLQPIFVFVRMPEHEADKVGQTLDVDIKGVTSGATQDIRLYRVPSLPGKRVIYTHKDAFSLGECTYGSGRYDASLLDPLAGIGYVSGLFFSMYQEGSSLSEAMDQDMKLGEGDCKDFDGQHLEHLEFTYKDAAFRLQYFDHWIGYTLARQESALRNAHHVLKALMKEGKSEKDRINAAAKLQMIENYWHVAEDADLTPLHKVAISSIYLGGADGPNKYIQVFGSPIDCPTKDLHGLLDMDPADMDKFANSHCKERAYEPDANWTEIFKFWDERAGSHAHDRFLNIVTDVQWTSPLEQSLVSSAIKYSGTKAMNDIAKEFTKTGVITLYQTSTNVSVGPSAADMYMLLTGYDIMGQKAKTSDRIIKGIQIGADIITMGVDLHEATHPQMFFNEKVTKRSADDKTGLMSGWSNNKSGSRSKTHMNDIADDIIKKAEKKERTTKTKKVSNTLVNSKYGDLSGWKRNLRGKRSSNHLLKHSDKIIVTAVRQQSGTASTKIMRHIDGALSGDIKITDKANAKTVQLPSGLSDKQKKQLSIQLSDSLPKPEDMTATIKTYPDMKMRASGNLPDNAKTRKITTADVQKSYGNKTQIIQDKRTQNRSPLPNKNLQAQSNASHIIATQSGRDYSQVNSPAAMTATLDAAAANGTVSIQGRKHAGLTHPHNVNTMHDFYKANGYDMVVSDPKMNKRVNAKDVSSAIKSGAWVETVMEIPDANGTPTLRNIIIEDVLLDPNGTPTKIAAFDPQLQKLIKMDAEDFNKTMARDMKQGNMRVITSQDSIKTTAIAPGRYTFPDNAKTVKIDADSAPTIKIDPAAQKTVKLKKAGDVKHFSDKYDVDKTQKLDNATFRQNKTEKMDADIVADAKAQSREKFQKRGTENLPADSDIAQQQKDMYQQDFQNKGTEKLNAADVKTAKADADLDPNFGMNPDPDAAAKQHQKTMDSDFAKDPAGKRSAEDEDTIKTGRFTPDADDMKQTRKGDAGDHTATQKHASEGSAKTLPPAQHTNTPKQAHTSPISAMDENAPPAGQNYAFRTQSGEQVNIPLGDVIGEGVAAKVYNHADNPDLVIKVSTGNLSNDLGSKIDDLGRLPFESVESKIDSKYLRIPERGKLYKTTNGKSVQIIEKAKGDLASKLLDKQDKLMTQGQAYAFERASRMLNEEGFIWMDNHKNNFHLVKIADGDEWKIEIVDTGGILPAKGKTRAERRKNARRVQGKINNPSAKSIEKTTGRNGITVLTERMSHILHGEHDGINGADLIDFDAIQDGFDPDLLPFHPEMAYNQAFIREFAAMNDRDFKAYSNTIKSNALSKSDKVAGLGMPRENFYIWIFPHVLNYGYQMGRDIDGMKHEQ